MAFLDEMHAQVPEEEIQEDIGEAVAAVRGKKS